MTNTIEKISTKYDEQSVKQLFQSSPFVLSCTGTFGYGFHVFNMMDAKYGDEQYHVETRDRYLTFLENMGEYHHTDRFKLTIPDETGEGYFYDTMPFANGFISRGSFVYGVEHEDSLIHVMLRHQETTIHKITVSFSDAWPDDTKLDKFNGYFGDYPWVRPESFLKRNMLNETMMGHLFWADDHPPK
jgi:hypothetical protein